MNIKLVVAVTDIGWYRHLKHLQDAQGQLELANFWSRKIKHSFRALREGELFLFKPKKSARRGFSEHVIAGGGIFGWAQSMPLAAAWQCFGAANGADGRGALNKAIDPGHNNPVINCRILKQPFFFEEKHFLPLPNWSSSIQTYKIYDTAEPAGRWLWDAIGQRLQPAGTAAFAGDIGDRDRLGSGYGGPRLIQTRLGQQGFRMAVLDNYQYRCIVTRERTLPALEAAHIRPYSEAGQHELGNGLLLRSDIRKLFDAGYVTITPQSSSLRFVVSQRIKEHYENGRDYYALNDSRLVIPNRAIPPKKEALLWHSENLYLG